MHTSYSIDTRTKRRVVYVSFLVHALLVFIFFTTHQKNVYSGAQAIALQTKKQNPHDIWASTQAKRGAPVLLVQPTPPAPTHNQQPVTPPQQTQQQPMYTPQQTQQSPTTLSPHTQQLFNNALTALKHTRMRQKTDRDHVQKKVEAHQQPQELQEKKRTIKNVKKTPKSQHKQHTTTRQEPARQLPTLAQITKSFMNHAQKDGQHTITVEGDPRKTPTAQQLKQHHYIEKLQHCLHTSWATMKDRQPSITNTVENPCIQLLVHKDGSATNIHVTQTSHNTHVDSFIVDVFKDASRSFPPLPSYFPHHPYTLHWKIIIQ